MSARSPFPLQWPEGYPRTPPGRRGRPKFGHHFATDRDSVIRQLKRRGSHVVITSNLPTNRQGLPLATGAANDPGIAVWWVEKGTERVIACDRWRNIADNLRAIEMSLAALRGLDRWGASDMVERAFAGFAALPAPATAKRHWREVLGMPTGPDATRLGDHTQLRIARELYRQKMATTHPDQGGDHEAAVELNRAMAEAEEDLG